MKHAFLILCHGDFSVLQYLISFLDHNDHDIYIHFDKKVKKLPTLRCELSYLEILDERVDVRWGHRSMIESELLLIDAALKRNEYSYLHVISGVHFPICTMQNFHMYFEKIAGASVFLKMYSNYFEFDMKLVRYNFFIKYFRDQNLKGRLANLLWRIFLRLQKLLRIKRFRTQDYIKASQWCSITKEAAAYISKSQKAILKEYKYTLCGDEFFIPSALNRSPLKNRIIFDNHYLKCDFNNGYSPKVYTLAEYEELINGNNHLFARKFNDENIDVVKKLFAHLGDNKTN